MRLRRFYSPLNMVGSGNNSRSSNWFSNLPNQNHHQLPIQLELLLHPLLLLLLTHLLPRVSFLVC